MLQSLQKNLSQTNYWDLGGLDNQMLKSLGLQNIMWFSQTQEPKQG